MNKRGRILKTLFVVAATGGGGVFWAATSSSNAAPLPVYTCSPAMSKLAETIPNIAALQRTPEGQVLLHVASDPQSPIGAARTATPETRFALPASDSVLLEQAVDEAIGKPAFNGKRRIRYPVEVVVTNYSYGSLCQWTQQLRVALKHPNIVGLGIADGSNKVVVDLAVYDASAVQLVQQLMVQSNIPSNGVFFQVTGRYRI